jgi:hypothetical protein
MPGPELFAAFSFAAAALSEPALPVAGSPSEGQVSAEADTVLLQAISTTGKTGTPFQGEETLEQEAGWTGGLLKPEQNDDLTQVISTLNPQTTDQEPAPTPARDQGFRIRVGDVDIRPLLELGTLYDDNILQTPSGKIHDLITSVTPGILIAIGDYVDRKESFVSLLYAPNFVLYQDHEDLNASNQALVLGGQILLQRLTLAGVFQWEKTLGTSRDAGERIGQEVSTAELRGSYALSENVVLELRGSETLRTSTTRIDSTEDIVRNWVTYKVTSKIDSSGGITLGFIRPSAGPAVSYQQLLVRSRLESTEKLSFTASAGLEFRQFESGEDALLSPVFDLAAKWTPVSSNEISLSAYRRLSSSSAGQAHNYITTGGAGSVRQRIFGELKLELSGGYEHSAYFSTDKEAAPSQLDNRADNYTYGRMALSLPIRSQSSISIHYLYRYNCSSVPQYKFDNNQVGLEWKTTF